MSRLLNALELLRFKSILRDYRLDPDLTSKFIDSNFAVIAGPAGAGKDTLRNDLIAEYPETYVPILSTTTRPPREGEIDGRDYHFKEIEEVERDLIKRSFFQAVLVHEQQVSCLHISEIEKLKKDQIGLSILIPYTEQMLRDIKQDIKTVFLIPPSLDSLLQRIQSERLLNQAEVGRRKAAAVNEIKLALSDNNYYCLISETRKGVAVKAHDFFANGHKDDQADSDAREIMNNIMLELSYGK